MQAARREGRGSRARPSRDGGFEGTCVQASPAAARLCQTPTLALPAQRGRVPSSRAPAPSSPGLPSVFRLIRHERCEQKRPAPAALPGPHGKPPRIGQFRSNRALKRLRQTFLWPELCLPQPGTPGPGWCNAGTGGRRPGDTGGPSAGRAAELAASAFQAAHASGRVPGVFTYNALPSAVTVSSVSELLWAIGEATAEAGAGGATCVWASRGAHPTLEARDAGGTRCGRRAQPRPRLVGDVAPRGPRGRRVPSRRRGPSTAVASCPLATARALGDRMEHRRRRLREARERSFSRSPRGVLPRHWSLSSSASPPTWDRAPRREMKGDACPQLPALGGDPVPVRHRQV